MGYKLKTVRELVDQWNAESHCDSVDHIISAGDALASRLESILAGRYRLEDEDE